MVKESLVAFRTLEARFPGRPAQIRGAGRAPGFTFDHSTARRKGMKKTVFAVLLALMWTVSASLAAELKIGDKAPDFKLQDSTGKEYTLEDPRFKGKVLYIAYVDPDEKDTNNHVEDALKKERESGGLDKTRYEGFGIANLKASNLPNFLIKLAIKSKQEKTGAVVLLDYDYTILNLWGLKNDSSEVVVLDKERICRYIFHGKLPPEELANMIQIIKEYQVK
jgi:predicted transcriptional regulator